jgi:hypothetical protein
MKVIPSDGSVGDDQGKGPNLSGQCKTHRVEAMLGNQERRHRT